MPGTQREIALPTAAHRLRMRPGKLRDLVISGAIAGRQMQNGRWLVEESAIDHFRDAAKADVDRPLAGVR